SSTTAPKGGYFHEPSSPGGTTSECPAKQRCGAPKPIRAKRLSIGGVPSSLKVRRRHWKPLRARARSSTSRAPASAGVTLGQRISSLASSTGLSVSSVIVRHPAFADLYSFLPEPQREPEDAWLNVGPRTLSAKRIWAEMVGREFGAGSRSR